MTNSTKYPLWINGVEEEPEAGEYFSVLDPSQGKEIALAARGGRKM